MSRAIAAKEGPVKADKAEQQVARDPLQKSVLREYVETIVVFLIVLVFARSFVFMQSKIPTESMLDTLLVGDYILVNRFVYPAPGDDPVGLLGQSAIERGDVIVFRYPLDPDVDFVKRVVGLPGEVVEMRAGRVYVDGRLLEEPYVEAENVETYRNERPQRVPEGHFFVLGDNRDQSQDSRSWGFVDRAHVRGKAFLIWYSFEEEKNSHLRRGFEVVTALAKKIFFFPTRTRWERVFDQIE